MDEIRVDWMPHQINQNTDVEWMLTSYLTYTQRSLLSLATRHLSTSLPLYLHLSTSICLATRHPGANPAPEIARPRLREHAHTRRRAPLVQIKPLLRKSRALFGRIKPLLRQNRALFCSYPRRTMGPKAEQGM